MRKTEGRDAGAAQPVLSLLLGGLLALGIEMAVLLIGSVAVSKGILRVDAAPQITAAACLLGCLVGGCLAGKSWKSKRLLAGLAVGLICFVLILLLALVTGDGVELGAQALLELAACLVGGGLAGLLAGRSRKKKRLTARAR